MLARKPANAKLPKFHLGMRLLHLAHRGQRRIYFKYSPLTPLIHVVGRGARNCARRVAPTCSTSPSLANAYSLVSGNAIVFLGQAVGPYNFDIYDSNLAQPEVQSGVV